LSVVIGGTDLVGAMASWWRHSLAPMASFGTGLLLVCWVAILPAVIGYWH